MPSHALRLRARQRLKSARPPAGDAGLEAFVVRCLADIESDLYAEAHRQVDRILLARTLEGTGGNQLRAARRLGIGRETLRRRIREVGIHVIRRVEAKSEGWPLADPEAGRLETGHSATPVERERTSRSKISRPAPLESTKKNRARTRAQAVDPRNKRGP